VVSSALGTAASGYPAMALVGDVSLFHDLNVLGTMAQLDLPLTVIVIHNDGGGIFHFLPQADPTLMNPATFEAYLGTPHGTDFVAVAGSLGVEARRIDSNERLTEALKEPVAAPRLLELRTDRKQNATLHREIAHAVQKALG
jgi:2-succinyl-5-enolpyruvyl-6-hydroxy-3-cyclohexene-1-carboxylate synthase